LDEKLIDPPWSASSFAIKLVNVTSASPEAGTVTVTDGPSVARFP
jgi:hypothetical protein